MSMDLRNLPPQPGIRPTPAAPLRVAIVPVDPKMRTLLKGLVALLTRVAKGNPGQAAVLERDADAVSKLAFGTHADVVVVSRTSFETLTAEATEMRDALRRVGIFRSDEAGDDGSEWCVTLEPLGEQPVGSLDEALRALLKAWRDAGVERDLPTLLALDDDPSATNDLLVIAGEDVSLEVVQSWTPEERREVEVWAASVHLAASDNDDVHVPPRPAVIDARRATAAPAEEGGPVT